MGNESAYSNANIRQRTGADQSVSRLDRGCRIAQERYHCCRDERLAEVESREA